MTTDLRGVRRLLCLGAHCDDIEIGCGGTVLALAAAVPDLTVRWVVFTSDARRRPEALACAERFLRGTRAEVVVHAYRDAFLPYDPSVKEEFERHKEFAPDLVLTHFRGDAHQDHRLVGELTWNTFRRHLILEYEIPKYDGDLGAPSVFVPLDPAIAEDKVRHILECYKSQADRHWFTRDVFMALMRLRAMEANAGAEAAEAFYARKIVLDVGATGRAAKDREDEGARDRTPRLHWLGARPALARGRPRRGGPRHGTVRRLHFR